MNKKILKQQKRALISELYNLREAIETGNQQEINRQLMIHKVGKDTERAIWAGDTSNVSKNFNGIFETIKQDD